MRATITVKKSLHGKEGLIKEGRTRVYRGDFPSSYSNALLALAVARKKIATLKTEITTLRTKVSELEAF